MKMVKLNVFIFAIAWWHERAADNICSSLSLTHHWARWRSKIQNKYYLLFVLCDTYFVLFWSYSYTNEYCLHKSKYLPFQIKICALWKYSRFIILSYSIYFNPESNTGGSHPIFISFSFCDGSLLLEYVYKSEIHLVLKLMKYAFV